MKILRRASHGKRHGITVYPHQYCSLRGTYVVLLTSVVAIALVEPQYSLAARDEMSRVLEQVEADLLAQKQAKNTSTQNFRHRASTPLIVSLHEAAKGDNASTAKPKNHSRVSMRYTAGVIITTSMLLYLTNLQKNWCKGDDKQGWHQPRKT